MTCLFCRARADRLCANLFVRTTAGPAAVVVHIHLVAIKLVQPRRPFLGNRAVIGDRSFPAYGQATIEFQEVAMEVEQRRVGGSRAFRRRAVDDAFKVA